MSMKEELYKKFKAVPTRPGRGGTYSYIKWQDIADRMNTIFGTQWDSEVVYQDVINSNIVIRVRVTILDTNSGDMFFQEGFGGAPMDDRQEAGNPFKSAYSKALKDACKKWGIGLYLDEDGQNLTESPVVIPTNTTIPESIESFIPTNHTADNGLVMDTVTVKQHETPSVVSPNKVKTTNVTIPPIPPMPISDAKPVNSGVTMDTQTTISDVQKAALQSILSIQGVEYEELVKNAFISKKIEVPEKVPTIDNLLYKEAVVVIKYGSDKFRKH